MLDACRPLRRMGIAVGEEIDAVKKEFSEVRGWGHVFVAVTRDTVDSDADRVGDGLQVGGLVITRPKKSILRFTISPTP